MEAVPCTRGVPIWFSQFNLAMEGYLDVTMTHGLPLFATMMGCWLLVVSTKPDLYATKQSLWVNFCFAHAERITSNAIKSFINNPLYAASD